MHHEMTYRKDGLDKMYCKACSKEFVVGSTLRLLKQKICCPYCRSKKNILMNQISQSEIEPLHLFDSPIFYYTDEAGKIYAGGIFEDKFYLL